MESAVQVALQAAQKKLSCKRPLCTRGTTVVPFDVQHDQMYEVYPRKEKLTEEKFGHLIYGSELVCRLRQVV